MPKTSSLDLLKKICDPLGGGGSGNPECFSSDEFSHPSETTKKGKKIIFFWGC
jgi:hypothetical protein